MKSLDMTTLLTTCTEAYRVILEKRGNQLAVNIADNLPPVYGNGDLLIQVMVNLLSNANAATKDGKINIKGELKSDHSQFIVVAVTDTGSGISPKLLPHVFERKVTGTDSSGIGLAICKEIITSHGGEIRIESKAGEGTTVFFSLPIEENDGN